MPKVISRFAVSSSTNALPTPSSSAALRLYYCICSEFILVINCHLNSLATRKSDGSFVIRAQDNKSGREAHAFKLNVVFNDPILLERPGGHEKQYRFHCPRCALPIGYQSAPPPLKSGPYIYIFTGALTQMQGQLPQGAFDEKVYED